MNTVGEGDTLRSLDVIDAHSHVSDIWSEPVESLISHMDRSGIRRAVIQQIGGQFDNSYLRECVRRYPGRFACDVRVDVSREDACEVLEREVHEGIAGLRLSTFDRSPGNDPLAIWRTAERLHLPVSAAHGKKRSDGIPEGYATREFTELIEELPNLRIIMEHFGGHSQPDSTEDDVKRREHAFRLSRFPNVYMKVSGIGEIAGRVPIFNSSDPYRHPIPPYHLAAYKAFGAQRLMWGSDFVPVLFREGYAGALASCMKLYADLPLEEQRSIFGGTADLLYFSNPQRP